MPKYAEIYQKRLIYALNKLDYPLYMRKYAEICLSMFENN